MSISCLSIFCRYPTEGILNERPVYQVIIYSTITDWLLTVLFQGDLFTGALSISGRPVYWGIIYSTATEGGLWHKTDNQKINMTEERHDKRKTRQKNDTTKERHDIRTRQNEDNRQNDNRSTCRDGLLSHRDRLLYLPHFVTWPIVSKRDEQLTVKCISVGK